MKHELPVELPAWVWLLIATAILVLVIVVAA